MAELTCECGETVSGPDADDVAATMQRHIDKTGHAQAQSAMEEPETDDAAPTEGE